MPLFTATFDPAWATVGLVVDGAFWPAPGVRTNLCINPNMETNITNWTAAGGAAPATITRDTTIFHSGAASLKAVCSGAAIYQGVISTASAMAALVVGASYTVSAWVYSTVAGNVRVGLTSTTPTVLQTTVLANTWTRVSYTGVANSAALPQVVIDTGNVARATTLYIDDVLVEQSATTNTYFDGDTPDVPPTVYAWTGAPRASTSTATTYTITNITITRQVTGQEDLPVRGVESLAVLGGYFVGSDPEAPLSSSVTYRVDGYLAAVFVQSATATVVTTGAADGLWVKVPGDPSATVLTDVDGIGDTSSPTIGGVYQVVGGGSVSQSVANWSGISADQLGVTLRVELGDVLTRIRAALDASRVLLIQPVNVQDVDAGWYFVGNVSRSNPGQYDGYPYRLVSLALTRVGVPAGDGQGIPGWTCAAVLDTYATCAVMLAAKATCFDLLQGA